MDIHKIFNNPRTLKAMLGLPKMEFDDLLITFSQCVIEDKHKTSTAKVRKFGGGRISTLKTIEEKLFYILFYIKVYPTFDVAGAWFEFDRTNACKNTRILLSSLEKSLGRKIVLPDRKVSSLEELFQKFPEIKDVFVDGLERPVQRPRKQKQQRKLYSGKKKIHTRKTVIMTDENKKILFLTKTKSGRRHDKRIADKNQLFEHIPEHITLLVDTGFQGVIKQHQNTMIPKKATRKRSLTYEDKENNRIISSFRVIVEHAIGGIKRFHSVSEKYRNHTRNMDDQLLLIASGLWNLHLRQTT